MGMPAPCCATKASSPKIHAKSRMRSTARSRRWIPLRRSWTICRSRPENPECASSNCNQARTHPAVDGASNKPDTPPDTCTFVHPYLRLLRLEWSDSAYIRQNDIHQKNRFEPSSGPVGNVPALQFRVNQSSGQQHGTAGNLADGNRTLRAAEDAGAGARMVGGRAAGADGVDQPERQQRPRRQSELLARAVCFRGAAEGRALYVVRRINGRYAQRCESWSGRYLQFG